MLYSQIASTLQEISGSPRGGKADRTSVLLRQAAEEPEMLCPMVRLLTGELWPRWEGRVMGIGPEAVAAALADLCDIDLSLERQQNDDMGLVAEAALQHKKQISLFDQPMDALFVYDGLRRISSFKGNDSEERKIAVLRGLFLLASPLEGKFIARTALRSMQAGLGPRTMMQALSSALACDRSSLARAFGLMPDLGRIALMACLGRLDEVSIQPNLPARFMIYSRRDEFFPAPYLPKFPGLRVQVHKAGESVRIFTSQLREISSSLEGLCQDVGQLKPDFVADAILIGFVDLPSNKNSARSRICSLREMLRYINRRRLGVGLDGGLADVIRPVVDRDFPLWRRRHRRHSARGLAPGTVVAAGGQHRGDGGETGAGGEGPPHKITARQRAALERVQQRVVGAVHRARRSRPARSASQIRRVVKTSTRVLIALMAGSMLRRTIP